MSLRVSPCDIMAEVLTGGLEVSAFELQLCYYVHFRISALWTGMNQLISQLIGLVVRVFANGPGDRGSILGRVILKI